MAKANKVPAVEIIGQLADRQEGRGKSDDDAGEGGHDVRGVELGWTCATANREAVRRAP